MCVIEHKGDHILQRTHLLQSTRRLRPKHIAIAILLLLCATSAKEFGYYEIDYYYSTDLSELKRNLELLGTLEAVPSYGAGQFEITLNDNSSFKLDELGTPPLVRIQLSSNGAESQLRLLQIRRHPPNGLAILEQQLIHRLPGFVSKDERMFYHDRSFNTLIALLLLGISLIPLLIGLILRRSQPKRWRFAHILMIVMFAITSLGCVIAIITILSNYHIGGPA